VYHRALTQQHARLRRAYLHTRKPCMLDCQQATTTASQSTKSAGMKATRQHRVHDPTLQKLLHTDNQEHQLTSARAKPQALHTCTSM
jgi:hypothetical protein